MNSTAPAPTAPASRRLSPWWRSWRWLRWLGGLLLVLIVALVVLWQMRLQLVRKAIARALPEFPAQVATIDWQRGGLELTGLKLEDATTRETWLELPRAHLSVNPMKLAQGELGELTVDQAKLRLTPAILQQLKAPKPNPSKAPTTFHCSGIHVNDATLNVQLASGETAAVVLNWQGGATTLHASGDLQAERQVITLRQLKVQPDAQTPGATAGEISLECSAEAATQQLTIHKLRTTQLSAQAGAALWKALGLAQPNAPMAPMAAVASDSLATPPAASPITTIKLEDVAVGPIAVNFQDLPWLPKLPPGHGQVTFQAQNVTSSLAHGPSAGEVQFKLTDFHLGDLIAIPSMTATAHALPDGAWRVQSFSLLPTEIRLATQRLAAFGLSGWIPELEIAGTLQAEARDLTIQGNTITSDASQEVQLNHVSVQRPGADHALLRWEEFSAAGQWEEITTEKRFRRLQWTKPEISLQGDDLANLTPPNTDNPETPNSGLPAWHGWRCDDPRITDGRFQAQQWGGMTPNFRADFALETVAANWHLQLENLFISTPGHPLAPPLYRGETVLIEIDPQQLWQQRRIERVVLRNSRVQVGVTDADAQVPETPLDSGRVPTSVPAPIELDLGLPPLDWHIGRLDISNTKVYVHNLVPDAPEILIPLAQKTLRNIPLTVAGLRQSDEQQRIELPFVYVPGTRAGTSVADFDTNFVHFSLGGLMDREIELIELVNPKVYVGDSLFHYVDKLRAQSPSPTPVTPPVVTEMRALLASLITVVAEPSGPMVPMAPAAPGWRVNRLKALNGKLITTVKDSPLLRVPPLPFGADSSVREGKINAQLAVPPGLYKPLLGTELVVAISEGAITFNLPMKQKDNNLVQVFKADWLRYKQFRISNVTLEVTYDKNGVYARFWAKAYQGDLEGAFNLYLDDNLSWDMWLAGQHLETKELTTMLTPAYFNMTGPVSGKLIAQGDKTSLYQATGEFNNGATGQIKVTALEDAIKSIPADWNEVQRKAVIKLLETVRDFAYEKCLGKLRFYGLEGEIHLQLLGPDGARNFDIFSHDRRLSDK